MIHKYVNRDRKRSSSLERLFSIMRSPIVTEKSNLRGSDGEYFFEVAMDANKIEIKRAVEKVFSVKVKSVNTCVSYAKVKRFRGRIGHRSGVKKAMVKLIEGRIELDVPASS
ncbi:50S ribosomal protein L23 [Candidatus Hydrogenosomobacter endosymbioticus]|uniref:Large ribosomal subunit protein uL23 n=1 Tax=Candidatus Hydrogenosomobacter endosymbioticus TaxID=2558174 RepID=A0ABN6L6Y3_9PROT|nr:50S ribosomal protein L23 [Candidatus Hydrogenosomobacter endosymbioticus]BDB95942.1 50S ribosomal protein L23 [Candidatus Hydrogenosomobacter endosymbioticus]